jgi:hypothetical protein
MAFGYYVNIPVNYSSDGAQTSYPVKLTIYSGSGTNAAGSIYLNSHAGNWPNDIQFKNNSGTTLDFWRESYDSTSQIVWVECDSIASSGTTNFVLYYGDSGASDTSSGSNTFLFFDHFTTLDTTNTWDQSGNQSATIVDSTWVKFASGGGNYQEIRTKNTVVSQNQPVSIEMSLSAVDINSDAGGGYSSGAYPLMLDSSNAGKDGLNWYKEAGYDRYVITNGSGTFRNATAGLADGYNIRQTWQIFTGTQKHITSGSLSLNDSWSGTTYLGSGAYKLKLGGPSSGYVNDVRLDWVFIRKLTTNEPTWASPGSETSNATTTTHDLSKYSDSRLLKIWTVTKTADSTLSKVWDITKASNSQLVEPNVRARYDMSTKNGSNLKDFSGRGNDGTPYGSIDIGGYGSGISGAATEFDGNTQYISLGNASSITNINTNNLSLVAWVYLNALDSEAPIFDSNTTSTVPYAMSVNTSGQVVVSLKLSGTKYTKTFGSAGAIPLTSWTQIVFTFDGTNWKVYINKVAQTTQTQSGTLDTTTSNIQLGKRG